MVISSSTSTPQPQQNLDRSGTAYISKLAAAINAVNAAQQTWVDEIDAASQKPALMQDPSWRQRTSAAIERMRGHAQGLRVEPVPEAMHRVDDAMARAQQEAVMAADSYAKAMRESDGNAILTSVRHVDRMSQLIQQAAQLVRG